MSTEDSKPIKIENLNDESPENASKPMNNNDATAITVKASSPVPLQLTEEQERVVCQVAVDLVLSVIREEAESQAVENKFEFSQPTIDINVRKDEDDIYGFNTEVFVVNKASFEKLYEISDPNSGQVRLNITRLRNFLDGIDKTPSAKANVVTVPLKNWRTAELAVDGKKLSCYSLSVRLLRGFIEDEVYDAAVKEFREHYTAKVNWDTVLPDNRTNLPRIIVTKYKKLHKHLADYMTIFKGQTNMGILKASKNGHVNQSKKRTAVPNQIRKPNIKKDAKGGQQPHQPKYPNRMPNQMKNTGQSKNTQKFANRSNSYGNDPFFSSGKPAFYVPPRGPKYNQEYAPQSAYGPAFTPDARQFKRPFDGPNYNVFSEPMPKYARPNAFPVSDTSRTASVYGPRAPRDSFPPMMQARSSFEPRSAPMARGPPVPVPPPSGIYGNRFDKPMMQPTRNPRNSMYESSYFQPGFSMHSNRRY